MSDPVSHPSHYTQDKCKCKNCGYGIECITIAERFPFSLGAAIKYLWRYEDKGNPIQDLEKAKQYIQFEIDKLKENKLSLAKKDVTYKLSNWRKVLDELPVVNSLIEVKSEFESTCWKGVVVANLPTSLVVRVDGFVADQHFPSGTTIWRRASDVKVDEIPF